MRHFCALAAFLPAALFLASTIAADPIPPIPLDDRLELFVDDHLIDRLDGARLALHHPVPREVALVCDRPWEGNVCAYFTVFRDGELCRMYYRGAHYDERTKSSTHEELYCYAESGDGIEWAKPELGLFEFRGSKKNNIV